MGKKWTKEQKAKFKATMAAKKAAKADSSLSDQIFPLALIPPMERRTPAKKVNSRDMNVEAAIIFMKIVQQLLNSR